MNFFIFLIFVVAPIIIVSAIISLREPSWLISLLANKTPEQISIIRFFTYRGEPKIFRKEPTISPQEYLEIQNRHIANISKQKALMKLNLDEDEIKDVDPVHFLGYHFYPRFIEGGNEEENSDDPIFWRVISYSPKVVITNKMTITWILFSREQIHVYQNTTNFATGFQQEKIEEYYYQDVTCFSAETDSLGNLNLKIIVPGAQFKCPTDKSKETIILGMNSLLKERKKTAK